MKLILPIILSSLALMSGCKPSGEDSGLKAGGKAATIDRATDAKDVKQLQATIVDKTPDAPTAPVADDGVLWKATSYWKLKEGEIKTLAPKIFIDSTSIFFSTKNDPRTTAAVDTKMEKETAKAYPKLTAAEAKKEGYPGVDTEPEKNSIKQQIALLRKKEKMRVMTNLEVSNDNMLINGTYWIGVNILGKKMFAKTPHTVSIVGSIGIAKDSETSIAAPAASLTGTVFGVTVLKKEATAAKGLKYALPIPPVLDQAIPVYGLPALQIVVKLGIVLRGELVMNLVLRKVGQATLTFAPTIGVDAYVGPGATVGILTASIEAKLLIFETAWPVSATVGGSKTGGFFYGGITYDGQDFSAMKGAIVAKVAVEPPFALKIFLYPVQLLAKEIGVSVTALSWKWEHEIWAAKSAWIMKKAEGYAGPAFIKVLAGKCPAAKAKIKAHADAIKTEKADTPDKNFTESKTSIEKMFVKIQAKGC